ncbi:hypothetical protein NHX12_014174, partial [Muraenolepis orangiensis]
MDTRVLLGLLFSAVCLSSAGLNKYILVTKEMTWQEAQEYCRQTYVDLATVDNMDDLNQLTLSWESAKSYCRTHYTDLAKIENQAENQQVSSLVTTSSWIGLSRVPWTWSDGSNGSFRDWGVSQPNDNSAEVCALIYK